MLHTNIVPIYSLHEDRRAGLRAVCMPYLGGASLSAVLAKLWTDSPRPVTGEAVRAALESVESPEAVDCSRARTQAPAPSGQLARDARRRRIPPTGRRRCPGAPADAELTSAAAAWIVAQLAEGLHHAHQRGILHRDIKPSNILISAEGQPLLLDFNLAQAQDEDPAHADDRRDRGLHGPGAPPRPGRPHVRR